MRRADAAMTPSNAAEAELKNAEFAQGNASAMKRKTWLVVAGCAGSVAVAAGVLVWSHSDPVVFGVVLGVFVSVLVTTVPTLLVRWLVWHRRIRASSYLWRNDIYSYQQWIVCSMDAKRWYAPPPRLATADTIADLAKWAGPWKKWRPITDAHRHIDQLVAESARTKPDDKWDLASRAFELANKARADLSRMDGGPADPHKRTADVERWARKHREKDKRRLRRKNGRPDAT